MPYCFLSFRIIDRDDNQTVRLAEDEGGAPVKVRYPDEQLKPYVIPFAGSTLVQAAVIGWTFLMTFIFLTLFCHCRMPNDTRLKMIACAICSEWFYDACEKVPESAWSDRKASFTCKKCLK